MTGGDRRPGTVVDDQATGEQCDALVQVFGGQLGGPMGALAPVSARSSGLNLTMAEARRSRSSAFGIRYEGRTGLSTAEFSWSA